MNDVRWLTEARRWLGLKEVKGAQHAPQILKWWAAIRAPFLDDETPWCAGFVGGVLEACGIRSTRSAAARSYLKWGSLLAAPAVGCVVVFERGPTFGHVGFVVGRNAQGQLLVLGGNQGDAVTIAAFDMRRVLQYRWPAGEPPPVVGVLPVLTVAAALSSNEA